MPVWEKHALPRDASQGSQSPPPRLEAPSLGSPSPVVPLLTQGCLEQGLFIDTVLSSLPLPEETAPGGDGPDLTALVDIPTGTVLSGNQRLLGIPPCGVQAGAPPLLQSQSMVVMGQPSCGPFLVLITSGWAVCPPRVLPMSLMGGSCFSQC